MKTFLFSIALMIFSNPSQAKMTPEIPNQDTSLYGKLYHIQEGDYYPVGMPEGLFRGKSLTRTVRFDLSAKYVFPSEYSSDQGDINKLFGFSDCYSDHQTNSARIGWRFFKNQIELHAYIYRNGVRYSKLIDTILPYELKKLSIKMSGNQYIFSVEGVEKARLQRGCKYIPLSGYQLYPYFGGTQPAPHDVYIKLQ